MSSSSILSRIAENAAACRHIGRRDALWLATKADFDELLFHANRLREKFCGNVVHLCSILNAKSGACSEDCAFCAQSARHRTGVRVYPLVSRRRVIAAARAAARAGADSFGIVTSGEGCSESGADFARICEAAGAILRSGRVELCVSIGRISRRAAERLREAGVRRINHNLETSARFFPRVCTTHSRADRVETVRHAKAAGLEVCCGGLFGMGETWEDRVDLALDLRALGVDRVPINFLNPIPGTPMGMRPLLEPLEALRIIAIFRFMLPDREIKVCGGREVTLRDLQSWMFRAGASGTMLGNYLTTRGRAAEDDLRMIADLGLVPRGKIQVPSVESQTNSKHQ